MWELLVYLDSNADRMYCVFNPLKSNTYKAYHNVQRDYKNVL